MKSWSKVKGAVCFLPFTEHTRCAYTGGFTPTEINQYLAHRPESKGQSVVLSAVSADWSMWKHALVRAFTLHMEMFGKTKK